MEYWANEHNLWTKMNFDESNNIDIAKMPWVFTVYGIIICKMIQTGVIKNILQRKT